MKLLFTIIFCLQIVYSYGQKTTSTNTDVKATTNYVSVSGSVLFVRTISAYKATVLLEDPNDLNKKMNQYLTNLQEKGIDTSKFTEKRFEGTSAYISDKEILLEYVTTSADDLKNLFGYWNNTIKPSFHSFQLVIKEKEYNDYFQNALADATRKAKNIAKQTNKKLGSILSVTESAVPTTTWAPKNQEENFTIQVVFEFL